MVYIIPISIVLIIIIILLIIWLVYISSIAYRETLTVEASFQDTYRYVPYLSKNKLHKINTIKIKVAGSLKNNINNLGCITLGDDIRSIINFNIINMYEKNILLQEQNLFIVPEQLKNNLKTTTLTFSPTVENLSVFLFNKIEPLIKNIGSKLIKVTILGDDIRAAHSRYKPKNYNF